MPKAFFTPTKHMDALDAHLDLIEHLMRPAYTDYWGHMLQKQRESGAALAGEYESPEGWDMTEGESAVANEIMTLRYAPTYWISPNVIDLVAENVDMLPDDARIHPYDLVTQRGFAYFDHPVELLDKNDKIVTLRAMSWAVVVTQIRHKTPHGDVGRSPGMTITFYSDIGEPGADEFYSDLTEQERRTMIATYGRLQMYHHVTYPWQADEELDRLSIPVDFGVDKRAGWSPHEDIPVDPDLVMSFGTDHGGRWMQSLFIVIGQRLMSRVKPARNIRKRMERREAPDWGEVRVIDLRRYTDTGSPKPEREQDDDWWHGWSHRHRVKAHWKRFWIKGPDGEKRRVWRPVKSYVRGPDHLPLIEKDDVYRAVR